MVLMSWSTPLGRLLISIISKHIANYSSTVDAIEKPAPADSSPDLSSILATTVISPCPATTTNNASTSTGTSIYGPISCNHCPATFKYERNGHKTRKGRKRQRSALWKHMKRKHPETKPDYQPRIYRCRYNCGQETRQRKSMVMHEKRYCAARKTTLRNQEPGPIASNDSPMQEQEQEHSTLEVGTNAQPQEA